MIKKLLCLLLVFQTFSLASQEATTKNKKVKEPGKLEIGINISSVLSRFLGNEGNGTGTDLPLLFRLHGEKSAFRIGIGAVLQKSQFVDVTTGGLRDSQLSSGTLKLGFERKIPLETRLSFYYGVDVIGYYEQDKSDSFNFGNVLLVKDIMRFGGGPILGVSYKINDRIRFHTEASIYVFVEETKTKEVFDGIENDLQTTTAVAGNIEAPFSIFFNMRF